MKKKKKKKKKLEKSQFSDLKPSKKRSKLSKIIQNHPQNRQKPKNHIKIASKSPNNREFRHIFITRPPPKRLKIPKIAFKILQNHSKTPKKNAPKSGVSDRNAQCFRFANRKREFAGPELRENAPEG
jgi:hypothetical protein